MTLPANLEYPYWTSTGRSDRPYRLRADFQPIQTGIMGHTATIDNVLLTDDGFLRIYMGYCWDMATGAWDTPAFIAASLPHDALCDLINAKKLPWKYRIKADAVFREFLRKYGESPIVRWGAWGVVRAYSVFRRYTRWW